MNDAETVLAAVTEPSWLGRFIIDHWGPPGPVSRGKLHRAEGLSAIKATVGGELAGVVSWAAGIEDWEIVTLDSLRPRMGVGTRLLDAAVELARRGCAKRLWLITTNDNLDALRFYQRRGWHIRAVWPDAVHESRRIKPAIPAVGAYGIPLRDEIELEFSL